MFVSLDIFVWAPEAVKKLVQNLDFFWYGVPIFLG
jgi:hypothetical protein